MTRSFSKKHTFTTLKMILILLMLNFSAVFLFGQTTAAVDSFAGGYAPGLGESASSDNSGNISAGIDSGPTTTSKPVDANVIVLPAGTGLDDDVLSELPKNDGEAASAGGRGSDSDGSQIGSGTQFVPVSTGALNGSDQQAAGIGNRPGNETIDPVVNPQNGQPAQDKQSSGLNTGGVPASGQSSEANTAALMQAELNKIYHHKEDKVAYLTFDDGPLPSLTSAVLDILKEQDVKATFFMIGTNAERYPEMVRREYEEGHGIGNHTYSHVFKDIYSSPEKYTEELTHAEKIFQSILGEDKAFKLTRFPGGSFGKALAPYREAVNQAGYLYVDWNSLNGDAETGKHRTAARLVQRLKETVNGQSSLVVLMHDAPNKQTTIEALPEIIQYLRSENYRFELLPGSR